MKKTALMALSAAAALVLAACSTSGEEASGEDAAAGDGEQLTLSHPSIEGLNIDFENQPETIVMDCYAYSSLHEYGIEPDALFGFECDNSALMGDADIEGIESIGQDAEIDLEKLAELRPDAIIGHGNAKGWSWFDEDVNAQLQRVAPFVPLPSEGSIDQRIADTREIAEFFGADVEACLLYQGSVHRSSRRQGLQLPADQPNQGNALYRRGLRAGGHAGRTWRKHRRPRRTSGRKPVGSSGVGRCFDLPC